MLPLADVAFGLILFELGYRINLRWLRTNPWIGVSGLAEALLTFAAVYFIARRFGATGVDALMLASLSMATSPATVVRVINEQKSSGQVTERALHLCALNCVLAVSAFTGAVFGLVVPTVLRMLGKLAHDATVAFALAVILLVAIAHTLRLSPVVATLAFGLVERHRRADFSQAQHNFGALGELLTVVLFVFAGATLDWHDVAAGGGMAVVLVLARLLAKVAGVTAFAHLSGISWRKGALTGAALAPLSVLVILLTEQAQRAGVRVAAELHSIAAVTMLLEVFGPIVVQRALVWAREAPEPSHAA
jgi:Kef-type K+ transport system membrane component KefB